MPLQSLFVEQKDEKGVTSVSGRWNTRSGGFFATSVAFFWSTRFLGCTASSRAVSWE
jgi:hypothetical protein